MLLARAGGEHRRDHAPGDPSSRRRCRANGRSVVGSTVRRGPRSRRAPHRASRGRRMTEVPLPPVLRIGCPMWAYKAWQGLHFPDRLDRRDQLPVYASWCNATEGNTTYYGPPAPRTVTAGARETPEWFRFMFKLPKAITHEHHLRDVDDDHRAFLHRLEPLGPRAEQLSIQLPPSFGPGEIDTLTDFISRLPKSHHYAVELRHLGF